MYDIFNNGTAKLLSVNLSPGDYDGPRNVYPSEDGKWLYVVCYYSCLCTRNHLSKTQLTLDRSTSIVSHTAAPAAFADC
jgi:carboxy-cis,cis-muconate cyclase